jgi:hypothetical protein
MTSGDAWALAGKMVLTIIEMANAKANKRDMLP